MPKEIAGNEHIKCNGFLKEKSSLFIHEEHTNLKYKCGNRSFCAKDTMWIQQKGCYKACGIHENQLHEDQWQDQLTFREYKVSFKNCRYQLSCILINNIHRRHRWMLLYQENHAIVAWFNLLFVPLTKSEYFLICFCLIKSSFFIPVFREMFGMHHYCLAFL